MKFYGCISVKPVGWEFLASLGSAAWWWERSPNYNNSNNFCNVNTDGSANNNNAYNSNGFAPGFKKTLLGPEIVANGEPVPQNLKESLHLGA